MRLAAAIAEAAEMDKRQIRVEQLLRGSVLVDAIIYLGPTSDGDSVLLTLKRAIAKGAGALTQVFCATSVQRFDGTMSDTFNISQRSPSKRSEDNLEDCGRGGILEIFVFQAKFLPTQEWTQAFCTLELEVNSFSSSAAKTDAGNILKNVESMMSMEHKRRLYDETGSLMLQTRNGMNPGAVTKEAKKGDRSALHYRPTTSHVHRTHIAGGSDAPIWEKGFQFGVSRPTSNDRLRVQVLHKGAIGSEFIGAVTGETSFLPCQYLFSQVRL
jgi:hypothetical protein